MRILSIAAVIFVLASVAACSAGDADSPEWMFAKANELYRQEKYRDALSGYQLILGSGRENGALYYNIGNCYFKTADYGRAILNYERALNFMPGDVDLKANYVQAMTMAGNTPDRPHGAWYWDMLNDVYSRLSINALAILASVLFNLLLVMIIILNVGPAARKGLLNAAVVLALLFAVTSLELAQRVRLSDKQCIAIKPSEAKFAPMDGATTFFDIVEGDKMIVVSAQDMWYKIRRLDGKSGWVKKEILEII